MKPAKRARRAAILRTARKIHRFTGALLFVFFFLVGATGLVLGWKKDTGGIILAPTYKGKSSDPTRWLPMHEIRTKAIAAAKERIDPAMTAEIDRIDVRPDKGMAKFLFLEGYWGIQMDLTTGEVLNVERRRSDFIENVHDGSIVDVMLGTSYGQFKLFYTSVMGLSLLLFTVTGFWLWYGPKQFKRDRAAQFETVDR